MFCGEIPRFQATVVSYNSAISASVASSVVDDMGFFCGGGYMRMVGWVFHCRVSEYQRVISHMCIYIYILYMY